MSERDPIDRLTNAAESASRAERVAGYLDAIAAADDAALPPAYAAAARARALCGLARDGEVTIADAAAAVDAAVALGERCTSLLSLAEAYAALGDPGRTIDTIRRVPKTCFRSQLIGLWRFHLWDLRARAAFDLDRLGEGFRYAERLAESMDREDRLEFAWVPPGRTLAALLDLADSEQPATARRARAPCSPTWLNASNSATGLTARSWIASPRSRARDASMGRHQGTTRDDRRSRDQRGGPADATEVAYVPDVNRRAGAETLVRTLTVARYRKKGGAWVMIDNIDEALSPLLPFRLEDVEYNDPMVVLSGPGWSLSVACPWRLMRGAQLRTSYGDDGATEVLHGLVGNAVVAFRASDRCNSPGDIQIEFDNGALLDAFVDSDLDPWVLRLPDQTFVGRASCV